MEVNINREVEDTFYRYKMPKLAAKVEGKGNGIKTVIVNITDIAKALYRRPIYVTKYFGCELGAQVQVDKNERYIVNGAHEAAKLQELLDGFIKKFVLCQSCHNPETSLCVKKRGIVTATCKACGAQSQLDVGHRLTQYIIKNPPDEDTTTSGKKGNQGGDHAGDETTNGGGHTRLANYAEDRDDDDWGEDTTEEAQLERMNELSSMAKSLALSADVEKSETERADLFFKHIERLLKCGGIEHKAKEIHQEADRLDLGPRVVLVVAEALLADSHTIIVDITKYRPIFVSFTRCADYGRRAQQYLLGAMQKLIEKFSSDNLVSRSCHILKAFYDSDIIEEETIIAWHTKGPSKKFVSKALSANILSICEPMVNWLKEAEEEESDDDDSGADEQKSSENVSPVPTKSSLVAKTNGTAASESSDDEIDIDAI